MNLTPRLKQILQVMLEQDEVLPVKELASRIGVSKRTVQREFEHIENDLKPYHIAFETKTGKGVWLSGREEDKARLLEELQGADNYDVSNRDDRRKRLILEILKDKGLKKLFYYASRFQVSEATISSDLEAVEGWLREHKLVVTRKPGSGIEVNGTEKSYRRAIRAFIEENMDTRVLQEFYEDKSDILGDNASLGGMKQILRDDVLKRVMGCISRMDDSRMQTLTENSYVGLVLHISIAMSRILKGEIIEQKDFWYDDLERDEDYHLAQEITYLLQKEFLVEIPQIETAYICLHIKGAKHQNVEWNERGTVEMERKELLNLINEMINAFDSEHAFAIKQDDEFIQGLLAHLQPTFIRLAYDMKISNPVLEDIKQAYPEIFAKSRRAAAVLEQWIGKPIPETETGFLAIHFGAAQVRMQKQRENIRQVSVGIICASGIGISRLMLSKLERIFRDSILLEAFGQNDLTPYVEGRMDFFVSSIGLRHFEGDVIQVNPLLNDQDIQQIRQKILYYQRMPQKKQGETEFTMQLERVNILAMQIKTILRYMEFFKVSNDINFQDLVIAISEKMSPYRDRQMMIQEDLERRERLGSQIIAELGFALLHTRTKGVIRPSFCVCKTKDKKAFCDPYFKGISAVLVMLIPVDDNIPVNSEIFGYVSSGLIEDYEFLTSVTTGEKEEVQEALSCHLRKFFNQYFDTIR